jgi:cell division protease FtsH
LVSPQTAEAIDQEVKSIVESAHDHALAILKQNRELLETISTKLLDSEVIEGEELTQLLNQVQSVAV